MHATHEITGLRLQNQQLIHSEFSNPQDLLSYLGALQAQDYGMAKWALGLRLGCNEKAIDESIDKAELIRTHIFRGTWHFVSANDLGWMLQVTAPHGKKPIKNMFKKFGLNDQALDHIYSVIEDLLKGKRHLTRAEILSELNLKKAIDAGLQPSWVTIIAELDGVICNGSMRGKQHTYALLKERIPVEKIISKEESLAKLARIYFKSHGPATLQDFIWWTGLPITEAKLALEMIRTDLHVIKMNDSLFWCSGDHLMAKENGSNVHFLPAFDEFLIGYTDRTAAISKENQSSVFTRNGIFKPVILINGKVAGTWKRTYQKETVWIEPFLFETVPDAQKDVVKLAAEKYGNYNGLTTILAAGQSDLQN